MDGVVMTFILRKCKEHGGPIITSKDLNDLLSVTEENDIKTSLRQEISFQKLMHPLDARGRSHLYKMNYRGVTRGVDGCERPPFLL